MDISIEIRKKNLQVWLSNLMDENIISRLEQVKQENADWWDIISVDEKNAIEEGILQLDNSNNISHSEMRNIIRIKYGF